MSGRPLRRAVPVLLYVAACVGGVAAQELEPRTFSNTPVGLNFIAVGLGHSRGNILLDPTLPVEDAKADVTSLLVRYVRSFKLWGVSAKFDAFVPQVWGDRLRRGACRWRAAAWLGPVASSTSWSAGTL